MKTKPIGKTIKKRLEADGWNLAGLGYEFDTDLICYRKIFPGGYEICIEICFGDCCVGIYKDQELLEPKHRAESLILAVCKAGELEGKYDNLLNPDV